MNHELNIAFNMATQIAYEELANKPFSIDDLSHVKHTVTLYYAAIIANNPDTTFTIDQLLHEATAHDIGILRDAVISEFSSWCKIPELVKNEEHAEGDKRQDP